MNGDPVRQSQGRYGRAGKMADGRVMFLIFFGPIFLVAAAYNGWLSLLFWAIVEAFR